MTLSAYMNFAISIYPIFCKSASHPIEFVLSPRVFSNWILPFQLKNIDDFDHLKQLPHLAHIYIKNNPLILQNTKRTTSISDIIRSDHFRNGHSQQSKTKKRRCLEIECFIFLLLYWSFEVTWTNDNRFIRIENNIYHRDRSITLREGVRVLYVERFTEHERDNLVKLSLSMKFSFFVRRKNPSQPINGENWSFTSSTWFNLTEDRCLNVN